MYFFAQVARAYRTLRVGLATVAHVLISLPVRISGLRLHVHCRQRARLRFLRPRRVGGGNAEVRAATSTSAGGSSATQCGQACDEEFQIAKKPHDPVDFAVAAMFSR